MYNVRKRNTMLHAVHQNQTVEWEISAAHEHLPMLDENWSERWCTVVNDFGKSYEKIWNFKARVDDVFVVTFIKCGTTWTQEAVWLLMNNLDFAKAKGIHLDDRSPFIDFSSILRKASVDTIEVANNMPSPRLLKSHLPANLLPKEIWKQKPKIIYVARNLKDVVVSSYHHKTGFGHWNGNINEFVEDFLNNNVMYTPYWPHVIDFRRLRNEPNICFLTYEEMKRDLGAVLQKLCQFLERPELTPEELKTAVEHLSFKNMRNNDSVSLIKCFKEHFPTARDDFQFMRRGEVGAYNDELTPESQQKINDHTQAFLSKYDLKETDIFGVF